MRNAEAEAIALAGGEPARELVIALLEQVAQVVSVQGVARSDRGEQGGDRLAVEIGGDRGGEVFV